MNISYRAAVASAAAPETEALTLAAEPKPRLLHQTGKVARLSCCCRLSELLPLVLQIHDEARALSPEAAPAQAA